MIRALLLLMVILHPFYVTAEISPDQLERYQTLINELRCLVCQNQTLADSNADLAKDMRNEVMQQIESGKSNQEIIDFLVARYGDFVRYRPPINANTLMLWFGPALLLLIALAILIRSSRRNRQPPDELSHEDQERLARILKESNRDHPS